MRRREARQNTLVRAAKRAGRVFASFTVMTALACAVPGCREKEIEKSAKTIKLENAQKKEFSRLFVEKTGKSLEVYDVSYPDIFSDTAPFDKSDSVAYDFVFSNVRADEVHEVLGGLKGALDAYYIQNKIQTSRDDKIIEVWYVADFYKVNYERAVHEEKGTLGVSVQLTKLEEEMPNQKKKNKNKNSASFEKKRF